MDCQFDQFLVFCEGYLGSSKKNFLDLIQKRYEECDEEYKESEEFADYLLSTEAKIRSDEPRFFVHLKQFLNILKENKAVSPPSKSNGLSNSKRTHESSGSENEESNLTKRRKLHQSTDSDSSLPGGIHIHKEDNSVSDNTSENSEKEESNKNDEETPSQETQEPSVYMESESESENSGIKTQGSWEKHVTGVKKLNTEPGKTYSDGIEADDPNMEIVTRNTDNDNEESNSQSDKSEILIAVPLHISEKSHTLYNDDEDNMFSSSGEESETDANNARNIESIIEQQEGEKEAEDSKLDDSSVTVVGKDSFYERNTDNDCVEIEENDKDLECDSNVLSSLSGACSNTKVAQSQGKNDTIHVNNHIHYDKSKSKEEKHDQNNHADADSGEDIFVINEENSYYEKNEIQSVQRTEAQEKVIKNNITVGNKLPVDEEEESDEVIELNSSGELVCAEADTICEEDSIMLNRTENFIDKNKDTSNKVTESEVDKSGPSVNKSSKRHLEIYSSDEEDPDYAKKAKKFREKCKKKYVVSVGKKKHNSFSEEHHKQKIVKRPGFNCPKVNTSPKKKKTPENSPKKKLSPKKSPIIIVSESESGSDVENVEDLKKKMEEKIDTKFREKYHIEEDPVIIIDKIHVKLEDKNEDSNGLVSEENDDDEDVDDIDDETLTKTLSLKNNDSSDKTGELKEGIKSDVNEEEIKEDNNVEKGTKTTKRISFITEELYSNDRNADELANEGNKEASVEKKVFSKGSESLENRKSKKDLVSKKHSVSGTKSGDSKKHQDEPKPGPSSSGDGDSVKKKGSTKQIRKLEALLESIRDQIERVKTRELDLDEMDSEVSDYILEDKLKRKFVKVFDKLCELHDASKPLSVGRPVDKYFRYEGTRYPDINRKIEKFINKRKEFPDYSDIRGIIVRVNKRKKLHLADREIDDLSREAFTDVGNRLQKRRQKDFISTFHTQDVNVNPFSLYDDPALYDPDLKKKLDSNKKTAKSNMDKVVEKYAALQYQVGDKTDDEEDDDDDDEDAEDNNIDADELDQLSGVDNSESDTANGDEISIKHGITSSVLHSWKSGPCLEIENVEDAWKSKILKSDEDIKCFSPMKSKQHRENGYLDPKAVHFSDQLGLTPTKPIKKKISITILSDNDDDNEVKCDPNENPYNSGSGSDLEVGFDSEDLSSPGIENHNKMNHDLMTLSDENTADVCQTDNEILEGVNLLTNNRSSSPMEIEGTSNVTSNSDDCENSNKEHAVLTTNNEEEVTVIIDEDDENVDNSLSSEEPLTLKIVSAHHVNIKDIDKFHGEEETTETQCCGEQEVPHVLDKREDIAVTEVNNIPERAPQNDKNEELLNCTDTDKFFENSTENLELDIGASNDDKITKVDAGNTEPVTESKENKDICTSNKAEPEPDVIIIDCPTVQMGVKVTEKNSSEILGDKENRENPDIVNSKDMYPQECSILSETGKTDNGKDKKFHEVVDSDTIVPNSGDNIELLDKAKHKENSAEADTCRGEIVDESKQKDECRNKRHDSEPDVIIIDDSALQCSKKIRNKKQHTESDNVKGSPKLNDLTNNFVQEGINKGNLGPQNYSEMLSKAAKNCENKLITLSQPVQGFQTGLPGQGYVTCSQGRSPNRNQTHVPQNTSHLYTAENVGQKMQGNPLFNRSGAQKFDFNLLQGVKTSLKDFSPVNSPGVKNYNLNQQSCQKISFDMQGHQKSNFQLQGQSHRLSSLNSNFNLQGRLSKLNVGILQKPSFKVNSGRNCNFTTKKTNITTPNSQSQNLGVVQLSKFNAQFGTNSKSNVQCGQSIKFTGQGTHGQQGMQCSKQDRSETSTSKIIVTDGQKMKRNSSSITDVVIIDCDETESTKLSSVHTKGSINHHRNKLKSHSTGTADDKYGAKSNSIKVTDSKALESKSEKYVYNLVGDKKKSEVKSKSTSNSEDLKQKNDTQRQSKTSVKDVNKKSRVIPDNSEDVICLDAELDSEKANSEVNNELEKDSDSFISDEFTHNTCSRSVQSTSSKNGRDIPVKMSSDKNYHIETKSSSNEITGTEAIQTSEEQRAQTPSDIFDGSSIIEHANDFSTIELCHESELFEKVNVTDSDPLESKQEKSVDISAGDNKKFEAKSKTTKKALGIKKECDIQNKSKASVKDSVKSRVASDNSDDVICLDPDLESETSVGVKANNQFVKEQEKEANSVNTEEVRNSYDGSFRRTNCENENDKPVRNKSGHIKQIEAKSASSKITNTNGVNCCSLEEQSIQTVSDIFDGSYSTEHTNDFSSIELCQESEVFDSVVDCVHDKTNDSGTAKKNNDLINTQSTKPSKHKTHASVEHVDSVSEEPNVNFIKVSKKTESNAEHTGLVELCKTKTCDQILKTQTVENESNEARMESHTNKTSPLKEKQSPKKVNESDLASLGSTTDTDNCQETTSHVPTACLKNKHSKSTFSANCSKSTVIHEDQSAADDTRSSVGINILENDTSLDISKVKVELDNPHIRNKLLQLKEVIDCTQPQVETINTAICKPVETRDVVVINEGDPLWGEDDENAGLIETYQEPVSTPFNLEKHTISSSSHDKIIILSDSE